MWQHVGGLVVYSLLVIEVQSPISAEMFAQLKHFVLRQVTKGYQQQAASRNDHSRTENMFDMFVQKSLAKQEQLDCFASCS